MAGGPYDVVNAELGVLRAKTPYISDDAVAVIASQFEIRTKNLVHHKLHWITVSLSRVVSCEAVTKISPWEKPQ